MRRRAASPVTLWTMRLELGTPVRCSDAEVGELSDVVIDPVSRRLTHVVVGPKHDRAQSRLVPIDLVEPDAAGLMLRCTLTEVQDLERLSEVTYLRAGERPPDDPDWDVGIEQVLAMPYFSASGLGEGVAFGESGVTATYDRVPKGEVEIRRSSLVESS